MDLDLKEVAAVEAAAKRADEIALELLRDLSAVCVTGGLGETCL
jgi:hypothetical protein